MQYGILKLGTPSCSSLSAVKTGKLDHMVFILTYHPCTRCRRDWWAQSTGRRDDAFARLSSARVACYDSLHPACAEQHGPVCINRTYKCSSVRKCTAKRWKIQSNAWRRWKTGGEWYIY